MEPVVVINEETEYELTFTLENVDLSIANALRRTILSKIGTVIFRTTPHERNTCVIIKNNTRLNNEILKQRLSCIPIHHLHNVPEEERNDLMLELNVENTSSEYRMVTSRDFRIKRKSTGQYMDEETLRLVFPPSKIVLDRTGKEYFIDFVKLRPKIADIPGEHIHLTCPFSWGDASEDGMFNAVSTCSYGFTKDESRIPAEFEKKRQELERKQLTPEEIQFALKDWLLLDSFRITKPDSFDFIIETLGVYSNKEIVKNACTYLAELFNDESIVTISKGSLGLGFSQFGKGTMENEYTVKVVTEDYTAGKVIEKLMYKEYFEGGDDGTNEQILTFCGFRKSHPHDSFAIIKLCYKENLGERYEEIIMSQLSNVCQKASMIFYNISSQFGKSD
jgi:DNA-directed RNA polymerase subunit L